MDKLDFNFRLSCSIVSNNFGKILTNGDAWSFFKTFFQQLLLTVEMIGTVHLKLGGWIM